MTFKYIFDVMLKGMDIILIFERTFSLINWCVLCAEYEGIDFTNNC